MKHSKTFLVIFLSAFLVLAAACSPAAATQPAAAPNTGATATEAQMMATPTEAMMATEPMMSSTAAPGMMGTETMMDTPTPEMMGTESMMATATPGAMMENGQGMLATVQAMSTPMGTPMATEAGMANAWLSAPLTDVRTGKQFNIQDMMGRVTLVEPMAQWCTQCLQQEGQVAQLLKDQPALADKLSVVALDIDPHEEAAALKSYAEMHAFNWDFVISPLDVSRQLGSQYGDQILNPTATPMLLVDQHGQVHMLPFGIKSAGDLMKAIQPYL